MAGQAVLLGFLRGRFCSDRRCEPEAEQQDKCACNNQPDFLLTKVTRCHLLRLLEFPVLVFPVVFFLSGPALLLLEFPVLVFPVVFFLGGPVFLLLDFLLFDFLGRVTLVIFGDAVVLPESPVDFSSDFSFGSGVSIAINPIRRSK
jgi:hypothetical protein